MEVTPAVAPPSHARAFRMDHFHIDTEAGALQGELRLMREEPSRAAKKTAALGQPSHSSPPADKRRLHCPYEKCNDEAVTSRAARSPRSLRSPV